MIQVEINSYKITGKHYTSEIASYDCEAFEVFEKVREEIVRKEIPGLMRGADEFHVVATILDKDGSHGLSRLFVYKD